MSDPQDLQSLAELLEDTPELDDGNLWSGLTSLADRLAEIIPQLCASSPVLISGDWGAGKTTLLRAVERRLRRSCTPAVPTVWFEAWRYEGESVLLAALMRRVWDAAPEEFRQGQGRLFDTIVRAAAVLSLRAAPGLISILGTPVLGSLFKGMSAAALAGDAKAMEAEDREPAASVTDDLWQRFQELLVGAWPDQQVVIFIDDLDRCSPEGAVALLDAIRMLLTWPMGEKTVNCRFVVALDKGVLAEAVSKKFAEISAYDGNRYLEKLFPVAFDLPIPRRREVGDLVDHFLDELHCPGNEGDHKDALSHALEDPNFANPRLMRRSIHRFSLVTYFEAAQSEASNDGAEGIAPDDPEMRRMNDEKILRDRTLTKWIAATERWPKLRQLLARERDEYWQQVRTALNQADESLPDGFGRELLHQQGLRGWLLRELLGNERTRLQDYREADARLRRWGL